MFVDEGFVIVHQTLHFFLIHIDIHCQILNVYLIRTYLLLIFQEFLFKFFQLTPEVCNVFGMDRNVVCVCLYGLFHTVDALHAFNNRLFHVTDGLFSIPEIFDDPL